ncbi:hypothetical protein CLOSTASPAR_04015 [[Clostridium] asparagiforme DSM 15981]|uniref:Uncharacterized protein n=1 Tax=[Clostridium] asparagiforme DSM 15981 TaxID=518636 RepID=C0D423_9FIRM|nr:hypothetical protein CLOSTASPAR_04015 [[Clostridium] asparagiforme DSM 15981]
MPPDPPAAANAARPARCRPRPVSFMPLRFLSAPADSVIHFMTGGRVRFRPGAPFYQNHKKRAV